MSNETAQTKKASDLVQTSSLNANDSFIVVENGGGCKRLKFSDLTPNKAAQADSLSMPGKTFNGSTMASLKTFLLSCANEAGSAFQCATFRLSVSYEAFKHFDDDSYVLPSSSKWNTCWIVLGRNSSATFDYIKFMATGTAGNADTYFVTCQRTESQPIGTWRCVKVATAEP